MLNLNLEDPNTYKLLTPGPLTTSLSVRGAMLVDRCTWDDDYKAMTEDIRRRLLTLAHADERFTVVLMQGAGTFGVESVLSSVPGKNDVVLVLVNGAYSVRQCDILERCGVNMKRLDFAWDEIPSADKVAEFLDENPDVTYVSMVHNETSTGLLNDIETVARVTKVRGKGFIVDAMSSFGAVDIDAAAIGVDFLVSSTNKCIQGVPGFSFIIANRERLEASAGNARSVSLDLYDQWRVLEKDRGKWRFTSPTHVVAAFHRALIELEEEGGIEARGRRYSENNRRLRAGMAKLGFEAYVDEAHQGPIITTFLYPENAAFDFKIMYRHLKAAGYVIYPGKLTVRETFRLGNIGEIYSEDVEAILRIFENFVNGKTVA